MLKFEGNTAAFQLYAYVRVQGIKRKVGKDIDAVLKSARGTVHPMKFFCFTSLPGEAHPIEPNFPNCPLNISTTLQKNHAFFRDRGVEHSEDSRLCPEATARILHQLNILASRPERMVLIYSDSRFLCPAGNLSNISWHSIP
jgi:arginyl-tRNA synthetase